jgi:uncharacterized membrane protein YvlD (DUF360 family)
MNKDFKYWLRWLAVLPGALLAGILAGFPLHWILYSTLRNETIFIDPYPELPERLLFPFVVSAVFIWIGSRIAPEHKVKTSVILFGLWMFLIGGFVFLTLAGANLMGRKLYFQGGGIGPIMAIAGAVVGLYIAWRDVSRQQLKKEELSAKEENH